MLEVKNLHKSFKSGDVDVRAVRDASFTAQPGEVVAIVGPSGSGKSTLLAMLGLLERPDQGSITINGVEVTALSSAQQTKRRATDIGFIFQSFNLIPNLSARENVLLALEFSDWDKGTRVERAESMLEAVGLTDDKLDRRPARLSGGEQQRVAIARAFASEPRLILADEPTGSLDSATGKKIVELLRETAKSEGAIVLVVTHDLGVAAKADRQLRIEDGVLVEIA
jgi:putative ABC transport system ATP-binding protein